MLCSSMQYTGVVWNRLQPTDRIRGSRVFRTRLYQRCLLSRARTSPTLSSPGSSPPTTTGNEGSKFTTNSQGTSANLRKGGLSPHVRTSNTYTHIAHTHTVHTILFMVRSESSTSYLSSPVSRSNRLESPRVILWWSDRARSTPPCCAVSVPQPTASSR